MGPEGPGCHMGCRATRAHYLTLKFNHIIMYMFHVFWTVIIAISYDTMLPCGRSIHWLLSLTSWPVHIHFCYFCWIHIHLFPRRVTWFVALLDFGLSWFVNFSAEPINLTGFPHFPRNSWNHSGWINIYCFLVFSQWIILVEYIYIFCSWLGSYCYFSYTNQLDLWVFYH